MGIETDAAGNRFEGLFQHGDFKRGRVVYSNGDIYQGDFLDDCKHGSGLLMRHCAVEPPLVLSPTFSCTPTLLVFRYSDGDVLRGTWINDELVDVKLSADDSIEE
jgi:hypothetical protein